MRLSGSGTLTMAVMRPGPDGFATAQFPGEQPRACEMTNLALPSAVVLKRPAAQPKSPTLKRSASALFPGTGDRYKVVFLPQGPHGCHSTKLGSKAVNISVRRQGP